MAYYDNFYLHEHPHWAQKLLVYFNRQILSFLLSFFIPSKKQISLLEVGPGKGYFYRACRNSSRVEYSCVDQNRLILDHLPEDQAFQQTVPPLPDMNRKFDIIYSAYLIEHLNGGKEVYEFAESCAKHLQPNGLLVLLAPDCLAQKLEFWNMDYTHTYPTTARNVSMILRENRFSILGIHPINGLLTVPKFHRRTVYWILKSIFFLYSYRFFQGLLGWTLKTSKLYELDNPF
jgi:SAM-dependent methyltransferase